MSEMRSKYDEYVNKTPVEEQEFASGGTAPLPPEEQIILAYKPKRLLDIGCNTGRRMFPFYAKNNIDYWGIENSAKVRDSSPHKDRILSLDISAATFQQEYTCLHKGSFDLIVLFGVINAFFSKQEQEQAWQNVASLVQKGSHLVVNTLSSFPWFEEAQEGQVLWVDHEQTVPQYFYARGELQRLFSRLNLNVAETKVHKIEEYQLAVTYYVLSRAG